MHLSYVPSNSPTSLGLRHRKVCCQNAKKNPLTQKYAKNVQNCLALKIEQLHMCDSIRKQ